MQKSLKKLSGLVKFDYEGFRSDFTLNIIEVTKTGLQNVGTWNSTEGINITRLHATDHVSGGENSLQNKSFVVLIALVRLYIFINTFINNYDSRLNRTTC